MSLPSFFDFSSAVWGRAPFRWQCRLADEVLGDKGWSQLALELPTGAGKTSAIDVALYCLAIAPHRMPRRTVLVVDRRVVVDQAADHARLLLERLATATTGPAHEMARALRATYSDHAEDPPFRVAVMRGGMPRDNDWARWPHQPLVASSTVDQLGSRLLFRGYGIHRMSSSIHAGLIGNDTLVLLDEVHLARPFAETLGTIEHKYGRGNQDLQRRFFAVPMSATLPDGEVATRRFRLLDEDRQDTELERRLDAHKLAQLVAVKVTGDDEHAKLATIAERAVTEAVKLQRAGRKIIGVIVNRVETAHRAYRELREEHRKTTRAILLTGRMRPLDRDALVLGELARLTGARDRTEDSPLIVVATQCIEAGADLDLDGIVTECASLSSLRQRFGRVDRRGTLVETRSIILGRSDASEEDPVYGRALPNTWAWLSSAATDAIVDFGIRALPPCLDAGCEPDPVAAPVLLRAHLDAWAQTSCELSPDPDVALWLHGPERAATDIQIVWRDLRQLLTRPDDEVSELSDATVEALLEAIRPSTLEAVSVPIAAARRWLTHEEVPAFADVTTEAEVPEERRRTAPTWRAAWRWTGDGVERVKNLRPGDVIVVDRTEGGLRESAFDPTATSPVADMGELAQLRARGLATIVLTHESLKAWGLTLDPLVQREDESEAAFRARVRELVGSMAQPAAPNVTADDMAHIVEAFGRRIQLTKAGPILVATARVPRKPDDAEVITYDATTESDDSSFVGDAITLARHSEDARRYVQEFARRLELPVALQEDLALAAWLHDTGKADPRFQAWLLGGDTLRASVQAQPLAKSALDAGNARRRTEARKRARYPEGCRHELLSLSMISRSTEALARAHDPELVKHLVASHHGWCRPFAAPVDDPDEIGVALQHGHLQLNSTTRHQLARLDSGVVDRFWEMNRKYGWWGLAWLEAILRLADHRASEAAETAKEER